MGSGVLGWSPGWFLGSLSLLLPGVPSPGEVLAFLGFLWRLQLSPLTFSFLGVPPVLFLLQDLTGG